MARSRCDALPRSLPNARSRRGVARAILAATLLLGLAFLAPPVAAQADADGDGLFDLDESGVYGTNPQLFDTDGDGSGDGEEVYLGTNPLAADAAPAQADSDGDGLFDLDETSVYGTGAYAYDTDGDGIGDGEEVYNGTDPLSAGIIVPPDAGNASQCLPELQFGNTAGISAPQDPAVVCDTNVTQSSAASSG